MPAGLFYLHTGHFNVYNLSPPLLRVWCALPVWWVGAEADFARRWDVDGVALAKECGGQEKESGQKQRRPDGTQGAPGRERAVHGAAPATAVSACRRQNSRVSATVCSMGSRGSHPSALSLAKPVVTIVEGGFD